LLGVNVYAWFIFVQQFGGNIDANVVSWDVIAFDENQEQIDELAFDIDDLYPGMTNFSKYITVRNRGTLPASFTYTLTSFVLFGEKLRTVSDGHTCRVTLHI
jgi:pyruvate-formate lyase